MSITFTTTPASSTAAPGRYSTQADLENVAGSQNLSVYSQLDGGADGPDTARIAAAMQFADAFIDQYFRDGPYLLPLSVTADAPLLTHWAAVIAVHWLYSARWFSSQSSGGTASNPFAPLLDEVLADMSRCKSGQKRLLSPRRFPGPTAASAV